MRDNQSPVHLGEKRRPQIIVSTREGLVHTLKSTEDVLEFLGDPRHPRAEERFPTLYEDWLAAGGQAEPHNPHPPVHEVLAMVEDINRQHGRRRT